jgi:predicted acyltransferase
VTVAKAEQTMPEYATPIAAGAGQRLLSLDVFRGFTIAGMILVNNPGSWSNLYWPLEHAPWFGWTPTDLVFPFFLFIVGTSLAFSLRKYVDGQHIASAVYVRIARRTLVLILLGLGIALFAKIVAYLSGGATSVDLGTLRFPGVLQRIALVYCAASLIVLHVGLRGQVAIATAVLIGYWALVAWLPNPHDYPSNLSPEGNVVRIVDRAVFGDAHLYTHGRQEKTDPEGLLSTLPSIVTAMLGYWCGIAVQRRGANGRTVALLVAAGLIAAAIGLAWGLVFPISKKLWTSSFVLLTGGLATIVFAGCLLKFDVWHWRRLARPWEIFGINAIFVYVGAELLAILLYTLRIGQTSAHDWLYARWFTSWIADPRLASLAFAVATVAFWWVVLRAMARRGWTVRV